MADGISATPTRAIVLSLRVGLAFAVFSILWIVLSDRLVDSMGLSAEVASTAQTVKGIAYVVVAAILVFAVSYREASRAEHLQRRSMHLEATIRRATDTLGNWTFRLSTDERRLDAGSGIAGLLGLPDTTASIGLDDLLRHAHADSAVALESALHATPEQGNRVTALLQAGDGRWRWMLVQAVRLHTPAGGADMVVGSMTDVTDLRTATERTERSAALMRALVRVSRIATEADTATHLYGEICTALVSETDARIAWIGIPGPAPECRLRVAYAAGADKDFLDGRVLGWGANHQSGPAGRAVRNRTVQVAPDIHADPDCRDWLPDAGRFGFLSCVAAPVLEDDRVVAVAVVHGRIPAGMDRPAREMVGAVGREIARALAFITQRETLRAAQRAHAAAQQDLEQARQAAASTVAMAVEQQAPFRAGHQHRVARLAEAIAVRCGLTRAEQRDAYLGAMVHDVGIGRVPGEILSRPGPLSVEEYAIVRTHAIEGERLVRLLGLSPAIAEVVRRHHERLDGSGYPDRLSGDALSRVVRIVAVADIAEAMLSPRPYRPAHDHASLHATLRGMRGGQLDAAAVDACLHLLDSGETGFLDMDARAGAEAAADS